MLGIRTSAARGMWRLVRACAITASLAAGSGLMTAPAHAQVVASGANAGQDVLGQWSARIWAAGAGGDSRTMLALMDEAPAEYPELNALLGSTVEHLRASFVAREEQRAEQIAEAETHLQEAFDKGDKPEALSEALRYAIELDMLAVDKAEFRKQPRIVELARRAHLAGIDAESKNDWMMASELFYRLTLIDEHNTQYKENWERISRRLSMIAMYAPERIWKMRNEKRLAEGETALPPYNPLGDGWAAKMEGVTLAMVSDAIDRSARMHVDGATPMSEMVLSGLEAVRNMATTEDLWEVFPGLADQEARERFLTQLASMSRDINADPRINKSTLQSILRQVASSSEWVGVDPRAVMHEFGNGAMQTLDEFSAIIWPDELRRFQRNTQGKFVGIGVQIRLNEESYIEVVTPLEGTPAQRIGVLMGDVIKAIDGNSAVGMSLDQAVDVITGPSGTPVTITIERENEEKQKIEHEYTIRRDVISLASVKGWEREGEHEDSWNWFVDTEDRIGYIRLLQFHEETTDELDRAIAQMKDLRVQALIVDLRFNPGGLLDQAVNVASRFIDYRDASRVVKQGVVVSTQDKDGRTSDVQRAAPGRASLAHIPVVVLVNEGSASASEIVSGAIQDYAKAGVVKGVVMGARSYGKGSVQNVMYLGSMSNAALKITTQYYVLPMGRKIHKRPGRTDHGVEPDIFIEMLPEQITEAVRIRQDADVLRLGQDGKPDANSPREDPNRLLSEPIDLQLQAAVALLKSQVIASRVDAIRVTKKEGGEDGVRPN